MLREGCEIVVPSCSLERRGCLQKWVCGLLVGGSSLEGMLNSLLQANPTLRLWLSVRLVPHPATWPLRKAEVLRALSGARFVLSSPGL